MGSHDVEEGFCEGKGRVDNDVYGNKWEWGIDFSPLKVVFGTDLDGRGGCEAKRDNRTVNRTVTKLPFSPISLKCP